MVNAKILAELVDDKLAKHYELDDSGKKKVKSLALAKYVDTKNSVLASSI